RAALAGEVGDVDVLVSVGVEVADGDAHAALGQSLGVEGGSREQALLLERAASAVEPELVGGAVVGDVEVEPAVAVEVGGHDAEPGTERLRDAGRLGDVR